jgi:hypothetical protein
MRWSGEVVIARNGDRPVDRSSPVVTLQQVTITITGDGGDGAPQWGGVWERGGAWVGQDGVLVVEEGMAAGAGDGFAARVGQGSYGVAPGAKLGSLPIPRREQASARGKVHAPPCYPSPRGHTAIKSDTRALRWDNSLLSMCQ